MSEIGVKLLDPRPRRTLLYLPASRASAVAKARTLDCDVVILDLEDAVAPDAKPGARDAAEAALDGGWGHREIAVRVNALGTHWSADDIAMVVRTRPDAVVVPKLGSAAEARAAVAAAGGVPVWGMIETPAGLLDVAAIAATPGITALIAGFADLAADLRLRPDAMRTPLHPAMSAIVVAARAADILAFDGVFVDLRDGDGLAAEARQAAMFGFDGKTIIHPDQIEAVNLSFVPTPAELLYAERLIAAHSVAGGGVTTLDGRMIESLHVAAAQQILAMAGLVSAR
jgi:citrate lyase subunit beta/citryl-CoA lyase